MPDRVLWNYYEAQPVEAGGYVVVHKQCSDSPRAGTLANFAAITRLVAIQPTKEGGDAYAAKHNEMLGAEYVPFPFEDDDDRE